MGPHPYGESFVVEEGGLLPPDGVYDVESDWDGSGRTVKVRGCVVRGQRVFMPFMVSGGGRESIHVSLRGAAVFYRVDIVAEAVRLMQTGGL